MRHRSLHVATFLSFVAASAMVVIAVPSSSMPPLAGTVIAPTDDLRAAGLIRRKAYNDTVLKKCQEEESAGRNVVCPDINDPAGMRAFMNDTATATGAVHTSAPTLTKADLTDSQRGLLRWYQRVGVCPTTLDTIADGLYGLCVSLIGENGQGGQAQQILNQLTPPSQSAFPTWTLDDFIHANAKRP